MTEFKTPLTKISILPKIKQSNTLSKYRYHSREQSLLSKPAEKSHTTSKKISLLNKSTNKTALPNESFSGPLVRKTRQSQYVAKLRASARKTADFSIPVTDVIVGIPNLQQENSVSIVQTRKRRCTIRRANTGSTGGQLRDVLIKIETIRQQTRDLASAPKIDVEERKKRILEYIFEMMKIILDLPFNQVGFQIKGFETLGDILIEFKDYKSALIYYTRGVFFLL